MNYFAKADIVLCTWPRYMPHSMLKVPIHISYIVLELAVFFNSNFNLKLLKLIPIINYFIIRIWYKEIYGRFTL